MRRTTTRVKTQIAENMTSRCSRRSTRARSACSSDVPIDTASSRISSTGAVAPVTARVPSCGMSVSSPRDDSRRGRNSQPMTRSADVVVVGAGIIGCVAAYFLAADGHRVVLTERSEVASGTAAASGGWIIIHDKETPAEVALALESRRLYDRLAAEAGVVVHRTGGMMLATTSTEFDRLRHQVETATAGGATVELLDGRALIDLEPELARDLAGGTYCPDEATAHAPQVCQAIVMTARARGVEVLTGGPVTAIGVEDGRVAHVVIATERIPTPAVGCACGGWAPPGGRLGGGEIPGTPPRGHLLTM